MILFDDSFQICGFDKHLSTMEDGYIWKMLWKRYKLRKIEVFRCIPRPAIPNLMWFQCFFTVCLFFCHDMFEPFRCF